MLPAIVETLENAEEAYIFIGEFGDGHLYGDIHTRAVVSVDSPVGK
ncbi:MAG: hypothetical protein AAF624_04155 [Bacteroidota bacterium]